MPGRTVLAVAVAGVVLLSGCTYMDQKADLQSGGPARREADARARQQQATDRQKQLFDQRQAAESDEAAAKEELDAAEQQLQQVSQDLDTLSAQLASARKRNAISDAEYRRLRSEIDKANLQAASAQLDSGSGTASAGAAAAKKQQIRDLQTKKAALEKALSQSVRP